MPRREFKSIPDEKREVVVKAVKTSYKEEPGYEWSSQYFGPPPGIPREKKDELDQLTDFHYENALKKLDSDELRSLMVSEEQRRRSFRNTWNFSHKVKGPQLAAAGFYRMFDEDKVKCAFCDGVLSGWIAGDSPMAKHKQKFGFCSLVKGTAKENIPFEEMGFGHLILMKKRDPREDARSAADDLKKVAGMEDAPVAPNFEDHSTRYKTFDAKWPKPKLVEELADAGFYYYGVGDQTKCFMCNGIVEDWTVDDSPWEQHAKWYYRCRYLRQAKGGDFIRKVRGKMTEQERLESENLRYDRGNGDYDELKKAEEEVKRMKEARTFKPFKFAYEQLDMSDDILMTAYKNINYRDVVNSYELVRLVHDEQDKLERRKEPLSVKLTDNDKKESTINKIIKQGEEPYATSQNDLTGCG